MRITSRRLWPCGLLGTCLLMSLGADGRPARAEELFESDYLHVVYNIGSNTPVRVFGGKIALDLTTPERWMQVLSELRDLGINLTTPLTSYGPQTIYPTQIAELTQCPGWKERELDGLQMLLDTCEELDIDCYPAVWLFRAATPELSEKAINELIDRYGDHPAFAGVVPPVEANPQGGFESEDFVALARLVKERDPGLTVMDYPNGPFSFDIMQTLMARSLSGQVDIQNVQFHPSDRRWDGDFLFARGLFHLVLGLCPGIRSIVHTHYKYGGGLRWIELDDLYRVHQAATLTATPHGTSIFSFLHAMWGNASSTNLDDPMERRLAWYKGILAVQRMIPYFEDARPANTVAIMIPRYLRESSLTLLDRTYVPLARAGIGAHYFVNEANLGENARAIVVHGLRHCAPDQLRLLQRFVRDGGALCILHSPAPAIPDDLSPRAQRVLGIWAVRSWEPVDLDPEFAEGIGLDEATGEMSVTERREVEYGEGTVLLVPSAAAEADPALLPQWVEEYVPERTVVQGMGSDFTVDTWHKRDERTELDIVMFMGTKAGARAENVKVRLPTNRARARAYLLQPDDVRVLSGQTGDGGLEVTVPALSDEFNALILSDSAHPFLVPEERLIRCNVGERVRLGLEVLNCSDDKLAGELKAAAPSGWEAAVPSSRELDLPSGGVGSYSYSVTVPRDAIRRPHFVRFEHSGLVQRVMLFPEDGEPQVFSDLKTEDLPEVAATPAARAPAPPPPIGEDWLEVVADDPKGQDVAAHRPGVCFLPGREWDAAAMQEGRMARYGERLPRVGAPNFLVNDPPEGDIEVRLTYWTATPGDMNVYDGKQYHKVADLSETGRWATVTGRVARSFWADPVADRPQHPGTNILFDVNCKAVYIHKIEVRAVP